MSRVRSIVENMSFLTEYNAARELSVIDASAARLRLPFRALHVSECVVDRGVGFGVAQHIGVLAGTR